ncbi:MAG: RNA-dependent DNA polymerase [Acidobacteria bacterium]|nr:RNA-dependent DNA polymerase [Acidobacteriota bacterium]
MKRHGYLFEEITLFANLLSAAHRALRGHQKNLAGARLVFHLEPELLALQAELRDGTYQPRPYRVFEIYEPKRRMICAADLRDRVVHHALCHVIGPIFERSMIADSFACRVGKGAHAAVARAQHFARRHRYYLQCDVSQYFASIDHAVLKALLRRKLKDARALSLLDQIIDFPLPIATQPEVGLPIGNLTSQHFANLYLSELDHFVKERLRMKGYLRYMDDFVVFGADKASLRAVHAAAQEFLAENLRLQLKERATVLAPVSQGLSLLGFRVFPQLVRLKGEKWRRLQHRIRAREAAFGKGALTEADLSRSVGSMLGHVVHADTLRARQQFFYSS